jgi:hypothetical protein
MDTFPPSLSFKSWQLFHHNPQKCPIRADRDLAEDLPDQFHFLIFAARLRKAAHKILLVFNGDAFNGRSWTGLQGHAAWHPALVRDAAPESSVVSGQSYQVASTDRWRFAVSEIPPISFF